MTLHSTSLVVSKGPSNLPSFLNDFILFFKKAGNISSSLTLIERLLAIFKIINRFCFLKSE